MPEGTGIVEATIDMKNYMVVEKERERERDRAQFRNTSKILLR